MSPDEIGDTSEEWRKQLPLTGVPLARTISEELKWIGFRYGAPIYRAIAEFNLDDVKRAFFGRPPHEPAPPIICREPASIDPDRPDLVFRTKYEGEEIRVGVVSVANFCDVSNQDFLGDLFPEPYRDQFSDENTWVIKGMLGTITHGQPDYAVAAAYEPHGGDPAFKHNDSSRVPDTPPDAHLTVVAVIACTNDGRVVSAVVQRVPSPANQMLTVPPV